MSQIVFPPQIYIEESASGFSSALILTDDSVSLQRPVVMFPASGESVIFCNFITPPDMSSDTPSDSYFLGKSPAPSSGNNSFVLKSLETSNTWYLTGGIYSTVSSATGLPCVLHTNIVHKFGLIPVCLSGSWGPNLYASCAVVRKSNLQNDVSTFPFHLVSTCFNYSSSLKTKGYIWIPVNAMIPVNTGTIVSYKNYNRPWNRSLPKNSTVQFTFTVPVDYNGNGILRVYNNIATPTGTASNVNFSVNLSKKTPCDTYNSSTRFVSSGTTTVFSSDPYNKPSYVDLDLTKSYINALDTVTIDLKRNNNSYDTYTGNVLIEGAYFMYDRTSYRQNRIFSLSNVGGTALNSIVTSGGISFWTSVLPKDYISYVELPPFILSSLYKKNPVLKVRWKSSSSTHNKVAYKIELKSISPGEGESNDSSFYPLVSETKLFSNLGEGVMNESVFNLSSFNSYLKKSDLVYIRFYRIGTLAEDTLDSDVEVTNFIFEYDTR